MQEQDVTVKTRSNMLVGLLLIIPLFYNNCAPSHNEGSFNGFATLSSKCDIDLLETGFKPYHAALRTQCASCHISGGIGNGPFADININNAFRTFKLKTETKIYTYATDPNHKPPNTGTANIALLDPVRQSWNNALAIYNECMSAAPPPPPPPGGGGGPVTIPTPTILTINKTVNLNPGTPQTITWRMNDEMVNPSLGFAGSTVAITVEGFAGAPNPYIVISSPTVRGGTTQSLYTKNMGIYMADTFIPPPSGATFQTGERYIPMDAARPFMQSGGAMIVTVASLNNLALAVAFEKFEAPMLDGFTIIFDPPTFANLVSTNAAVPAIKRIFSARCISCHSGASPASGIDISNLNSLRNGGYVVPFKPDESIIYLSISSGSMPPAGALPAAERDSVRFWLMDGAQ
jgi:mono/diheme cytochrome c family protein